MEDLPSPTYVEIICEAKLNPTEKKENISKILNQFLIGDQIIDKRFDGNYLLIRNSTEEGLQVFAGWIRQARLLDTVRKRLRRSQVGSITALYFNRQAAAMGRLALIDVDDSPPLGSISFQIVSDGLEYLIDKIAPRTFGGRELSKEEIEMRKDRKKEKIERRKRQIRT